MRLSIASYGLLLICVCLLIHLELAWISGHSAGESAELPAAEQAREYYELYENVWKDLVYFPIPESSEDEKAEVSLRTAGCSNVLMEVPMGTRAQISCPLWTGAVTIRCSA